MTNAMFIRSFFIRCESTRILHDGYSANIVYGNKKLWVSDFAKKPIVLGATSIFPLAIYDRVLQNYYLQCYSPNKRIANYQAIIRDVVAELEVEHLVLFFTNNKPDRYILMDNLMSDIADKKCPVFKTYDVYTKTRELLIGNTNE